MLLLVLYLLRLSLVGALVLMIDATEIGHDDRNRKCNDQDAAERTNSAHHLADDRPWNHVTIAVQHQHMRSTFNTAPRQRYCRSVKV